MKYLLSFEQQWNPYVAMLKSAKNGCVIFTETSSQKSSRFFAGALFFEPAIIAALTAPIEVPATLSNFISCLDNVLLTPHSYAPSDPPPYITKTVSD